jgi:hypothetical protein
MSLVASQIHCAKCNATNLSRCVNLTGPCEPLLGAHGTFRPLLFSPAGDATIAVTDVTVVPSDAVASVTNSAALEMEASNGGGMEMTGDGAKLADAFHECRW